MNITTRILTNVTADAPISFGDFLDKLGEHAPPRGNKLEWGRFLGHLESLEKIELITVERADGRIESLQLTAIGAELAREALQENR